MLNKRWNNFNKFIFYIVWIEYKIDKKYWINKRNKIKYQKYFTFLNMKNSSNTSIELYWHKLSHSASNNFKEIIWFPKSLLLLNENFTYIKNDYDYLSVISMR